MLLRPTTTAFIADCAYSIDTDPRKANPKQIHGLGLFSSTMYPRCTKSLPTLLAMIISDLLSCALCAANKSGNSSALTTDSFQRNNPGKLALMIGNK